MSPTILEVGLFRMNKLILTTAFVYSFTYARFNGMGYFAVEKPR